MGIITDILKEFPLSAVLRERLLNQKMRMTELKEENDVLKAELEKSQKDNEELRSKLKQYQEVPKQLQTKAETNFDPFAY